jgi:archaetidylinositol phosphate synthase
METFRQMLSKLASPFGRALAAAGVSPNLLSFSGVLFGVASAYFFVSHHWLLAVAFFGLSGFSDWVDGMVARARGLQSPFGSFFDNFCSAYADSPVFMGLIGAQLCDAWWGIAALVGTLTRLLTFRLHGLVSTDEAEALRTRFPSALFGKADRILLVALGTAFGRINEAVALIAIGTNLVAAYRCYHLYAWQKRVNSEAQEIKWNI